MMDTNNKILVNYVTKKFLKRLKEFAKFKKKVKDNERGKEIFGKNAD